MSIREKIYKIILSLGAIATILVLLFPKDNMPNLFLLPLTYFITSIFVKGFYKRSLGVAIIVIEISRLCRLIILPLLICVETSFNGTDACPQYHGLAIELIAYEMLCVGVVLWFVSKRLKPFRYSAKAYNNSFGFLSKMVVVLWFYYALTIPQYRDKLLNFSVQFLDVDELTSITTSSWNNLIFVSGIIFVYCYFFKFAIKLKGVHKIIAIIFISILYLSSVWTSGATVSRWSAITALMVIINTSVYYFYNKRKSILSVGIVCVLFIVLIGSLFKSFSTGHSDYTLGDSTKLYFSSQMMDEYFQGVRCVSQGIAVVLKYKTVIDFGYFLHDWLNSVPYLCNLIGISDYPFTELLYRNFFKREELICPTLTASATVFGFIGAPIYSCLAAYFSFILEQRFWKATNIICKNLYLVSTFWLSLFYAVNPPIIQLHLWPMLICTLFVYIENKMNFFKKKDETKNISNNNLL